MSFSNRNATEYVYGIHPVLEVLHCGKRRIHEVMVSHSQARKGIEDIVRICSERGITVTRLKGKRITEIIQSPNHQGVVMRVDAPEYCDQSELLNEISRYPAGFFLLLDRVQDAGNFGGILRSAVAFGVNGVLIPHEKSARLTPGALKASAGVAERVPITIVKNMNTVIEKFKKSNYTVVALEAHARQSIYDINLRTPLLCILGGEAQGVRPKIKEQCDFVAAIPIIAGVNSLSVAAAAAVFLGEVQRQNLST